jgi:hypothetical protein
MRALFGRRNLALKSRYLPPLLVAAIFGVISVPESANAVPSFAIQTSQPCSSCHVGAFGPRLKQAGRDFKLYGYSASDMKNHFPPFALMVEGSVTRFDQQTVPSGAPSDSQTDTAFDGGSLYYAGKIVNNMGAFSEIAYDGVAHSLAWQDQDVRYARDGRFKGHDIVYGVTVNNAPTEDDLWEANPVWSFPFVGSNYQPAPAASALIDNLSFTVLGAGGYAMWDDTLYTDLEAYGGLDRNTLRLVGLEPLNGVGDVSGVIPYGRIALQREFLEGEHYAEIGAYGLHADVQPARIGGFGDDGYTDIALDGTYQWIPHTELSVSDMVSVRLLLLHEFEDLTASHAAFGTKGNDDLTEFRGDLTYSWDASITPTLQYFVTSGSSDPARWETGSGSPDSKGWIAEIDYSPWGKPDSPLDWANIRLSLQFTAYSEFDGSDHNAADYDTLLLKLSVGAALNR